MFDRFTDRARKVCSLARAEAERFNHDFIGTEHFLLGLSKEDSGVAANVLRNMGIDSGKARLDLEAMLKPGAPIDFSNRQLPFTPQAKKVLEFAIDEARAFKHNYVGTEHLLLGLLREQEGLAAQVLTKHGVKLEDVRNKIREFLGTIQPTSHLPGTGKFTPAPPVSNTPLAISPPLPPTAQTSSGTWSPHIVANSSQPKFRAHRFWQIHLSTAIVVLILGAAFWFPFVDVVREMTSDFAEWPRYETASVIIAFLLMLAGLVLVGYLCERSIRRRE